MAQFNPCLEIEFSRLLEDGSEEDMDVELLGELTDLNYHSGNKPLKVTAAIQKSLGSAHQTANISIYNSPYVENLRLFDPAVAIERVRNEKWRVRIWAWHSDSPDAPVRPFVAPVFCGDILDGFSVSAQGVNDTVLQLQAIGHGYMMDESRLKRSWDAGTNYKTIIEEIFQQHFIDQLGYGREERGGAGVFRIHDPDDALVDKELVGNFPVNRNAAEILNDIAEDFDAFWGVNNLIPYFGFRSKTIPQNELPTNIFPVGLFVDSESGKTSMDSLNMFSFSFNHLWDNSLFIGQEILVRDNPQSENDEPIQGRINEMQVYLDNERGHNASVNCQYILGPDDVVLPPKRNDESGRSYS